MSPTTPKYFTIFSVVILTSAGAWSSEFRCASQWVSQNYQACENKEKPIIDVLDVTCPGHEGCQPASFKACADPSHGFNLSTSQELSATVRNTGWVRGGQNTDELCKGVAASYTREIQQIDRNRQAVFTGTIVSEDGPRKRLGERTKYRYHCEIKVNEYEFAVKESPACAVATWEKPKGVIGYVVESHPSCPLEPKATLVASSEVASELSTVGQVRCLTCNDLSENATLVEYAKCLADNSMQFVFNGNEAMNAASDSDIAQMAAAAKATVKEAKFMDIELPRDIISDLMRLNDLDISLQK